MRKNKILLTLFISSLMFFTMLYFYQPKIVSNQKIKAGNYRELYKYVEKNVAYKKGELIIGLKDNNIDVVSTTYNLTFIKNLDDNSALFSYDDNLKISDLLINIKEDNLVEYAEPNYKLSFNADATSETFYNLLWAYTNQNYGLDTNNLGTTNEGNNVVVAVVDTGVDYSHPDLNDNIYANTNEISNGLDDDGNGLVDDTRGWNFGDNNNDTSDMHGHGTHVSGIIAAEINGLGVAGVASKAKIMPLRIVADDGSSYLSSALEAYAYADLMDVKIINNSIGNVNELPVEFIESLNTAISSSEALFVCAAGNGGIDGTGDDNDVDPVYPGSDVSDNVIAVASINSLGNLSDFSNYGIASVDVAAPGENIYSTLPDDSYGPMTGTSMATPYTTGLAALILGENPSLTAVQIKNYITANVKKLGQLSTKVSSGGIINASFLGTILNGEVKTIQIKNLPLKTTYTEGQNIDPSGLTIDVTYLNDQVINHDLGYTIDSYNKTPGYQPVTINYQGASSTFNVLYLPVKPSAPTIAKSYTQYNGAMIKWGSAQNATGYNIYYATSLYGTYYYAGTTTGNSYYKSGLNTGSTYYFKVISIRNINNQKSYSSYSNAIAIYIMPSPPSNWARKYTSSSIRIYSSAVPGATSYEYYYSNSRYGYYSLVATTTKNFANKYSLRRYRTYYFKVRAYRLVGSKRVYSYYSNIGSIYLN